MNMSGGTTNIGSWLAVGRGGNGGTLNVSGGWINVASNDLTIASFAGNQGQVNISGGTVDAVNPIYVGEGGTGAITVTVAGVATAASVIVGLNGGSAGTLNLQPGGLLRTASLAAGSGTSTFNFSGGTLQTRHLELQVALPVNLSGQATVVVGSGQSGTFNSQAPIGGSGSLFLTGGGTLTLSGTNTYAGGTDVLGGELIVASPQGIEDGTTLYVGLPGRSSRRSFPLRPYPLRQPYAAPVPEPGSWALLAAGIACGTLARLGKYIRCRQIGLGGRSSMVCGAVNGSPDAETISRT